MKSPEEMIQKSANIEEVISKVLRLINENDFLQVSPQSHSNEIDQNFRENEFDDFDDNLGMSLEEEDFLPSNFAELLQQAKCNFDELAVKNSLKEQHRLGKALLNYKQTGERLKSCSSYYQNLKMFFKKPKMMHSKLKLAYIHQIHHHVDIGLLELFLLTYSHEDYHCIHISDDLTKETVIIMNDLVNCFNRIFGEKRLFIANQDTPMFWKTGKLFCQNNAKKKNFVKLTLKPTFSCWRFQSRIDLLEGTFGIQK